MSTKASKIVFRGYVFFLAYFMGGLLILYGFSKPIGNQIFVRTFLNNFGVGYFDFVQFWFFFIITPICFWWFCVRTIPKRRRPFSH